ncbi:MAG: YncE family protein [Thermoplasmatota archaeon]
MRASRDLVAVLLLGSSILASFPVSASGLDFGGAMDWTPTRLSPASTPIQSADPMGRLDGCAHASITRYAVSRVTLDPTIVPGARAGISPFPPAGGGLVTLEGNVSEGHAPGLEPADFESNYDLYSRDGSQPTTYYFSVVPDPAYQSLLLYPGNFENRASDAQVGAILVGMRISRYDLHLPERGDHVKVVGPWVELCWQPAISGHWYDHQPYDHVVPEAGFPSAIMPATFVADAVNGAWTDAGSVARLDANDLDPVGAREVVVYADTTDNTNISPDSFSATSPVSALAGPAQATASLHAADLDSDLTFTQSGGPTFNVAVVPPPNRTTAGHFFASWVGSGASVPRLQRDDIFSSSAQYPVVRKYRFQFFTPTVYNCRSSSRGTTVTGDFSAGCLYNWAYSVNGHIVPAQIDPEYVASMTRPLDVELAPGEPLRIKAIVTRDPSRAAPPTPMGVAEVVLSPQQLAPSAYLTPSKYLTTLINLTGGPVTPDGRYAVDSDCLSSCFHAGVYITEVFDGYAGGLVHRVSLPEPDNVTVTPTAGLTVGTPVQATVRSGNLIAGTALFTWTLSCATFQNCEHTSETVVTGVGLDSDKTATSSFVPDFEGRLSLQVALRDRSNASTVGFTDDEPGRHWAWPSWSASYAVGASQDSAAVSDAKPVLGEQVTATIANHPPDLNSWTIVWKSWVYSPTNGPPTLFDLPPDSYARGSASCSTIMYTDGRPPIPPGPPTATFTVDQFGPWEVDTVATYQSGTDAQGNPIYQTDPGELRFYVDGNDSLQINQSNPRAEVNISAHSGNDYVDAMRIVILSEAGGGSSDSGVISVGSHGTLNLSFLPNRTGTYQVYAHYYHGTSEVDGRYDTFEADASPMIASAVRQDPSDPSQGYVLTIGTHGPYDPDWNVLTPSSGPPEVVPQQFAVLTLNGSSPPHEASCTPPTGAPLASGLDEHVQCEAFDEFGNAIQFPFNVDVQPLNTPDGSIVGGWGSVPVGQLPLDVAWDPGSGHAFVANERTGTVTVVDATNSTVVSTLLTGSGTHRVVVDGYRHRILVVADRGVVSIDPTTTKEITSYSLQGTWDVAVDPASHDYLVSTTDGLLVVDPDTHAVRPTAANLSSPGPVLAVSGHGAYVADAGNGTILHVDLSTGRVDSTLPVGFVRALAFDPTSGLVFAALPDNNSVVVVDPTTDAIVRQVTGLRDPRGLLPYEGNIVVAEAAANEVAIVNASSGVVRGRVPAGPGPFGLAATSTGSLLITASGLSTWSTAPTLNLTSLNYTYPYDRLLVVSIASAFGSNGTTNVGSPSGTGGAGGSPGVSSKPGGNPGSPGSSGAKVPGFETWSAVAVVAWVATRRRRAP